MYRSVPAFHVFAMDRKSHRSPLFVRVLVKIKEGNAVHREQKIIVRKLRLFSRACRVKAKNHRFSEHPSLLQNFFELPVCLIIARFVYGTGEHYVQADSSGAGIQQGIDHFCKVVAPEYPRHVRDLFPQPPVGNGIIVIDPHYRNIIPPGRRPGRRSHQEIIAPKVHLASHR